VLLNAAILYKTRHSFSVQSEHEQPLTALNSPFTEKLDLHFAQRAQSTRVAVRTAEGQQLIKAATSRLQGISDVQ
jgi:hypothetical protein